jgi:hypothetical protein
LSEREWEEQHHDTILEGRTVQRWLKKEELIRKLNKAGVTATGNLEALQKLATEKGIPMYDKNLPKIRQGWQGKQKGIP